MNITIRDTVAITGMNAGDNPAPGVGVARALRLDPNFAGRVIGLGYDALEAGFYTRRLAALPATTRVVHLHADREVAAFLADPSGR